MAKASGTIQEPLTTKDYQFAAVLLRYSRTLPEHKMRLEDFLEENWGEGGVVTTSGRERSSEPPSPA